MGITAVDQLDCLSDIANDNEGAPRVGGRLNKGKSIPNENESALRVGRRRYEGRWMPIVAIRCKRGLVESQ